MIDSVVLTTNKLTKIESDDDITKYRANMSGQYVHSKDGLASIVDIKISLESSDKFALGKVGESHRITISPVNATLDQFEDVTIEHHGNEGDAVQKAKDDGEL